MRAPSAASQWARRSNSVGRVTASTSIGTSRLASRQVLRKSRDLVVGPVQIFEQEDQRPAARSAVSRTRSAAACRARFLSCSGSWQDAVQRGGSPATRCRAGGPRTGARAHRRPQGRVDGEERRDAALDLQRAPSPWSRRRRLRRWRMTRSASKPNERLAVCGVVHRAGPRSGSPPSASAQRTNSSDQPALADTRLADNADRPRARLARGACATGASAPRARRRSRSSGS